MMILAAAVVWTRTDRPARVVAASPDETTTPPPQPAPLVVEAPSQIGAPVLSLVLTDGALWASTNTDVLRIDPDTKQVVGRLRPQTQAPQALGGGRLLWTGSQLLLGADGTVDGDPALAGVGGWLGRIEPPDQFRLLQVLREDGANFLAAGPDGSVWTAGTTTVRRFDQRGNEVASRQPGPALGQIAVAGDAAWVAAPASNTVLVLDAATLAVRTSLPVENSLGDIPIAATGREVWTASESEVLRIDVVSAKVTGRLPLEGVHDFAVWENTVWAYASNRVYQIVDGRVLRSAALPGRSFGVIAATEDGAWLTDSAAGSLIRVRTP